MLDHSYYVRAHKTSQKEMQASQSFAENACLGMMLRGFLGKMVLCIIMHNDSYYAL